MNYIGRSKCIIITYIGSNAYIYLNALHMLFLFGCNLFLKDEIWEFGVGNSVKLCYSSLNI